MDKFTFPTRADDWFCQELESPPRGTHHDDMLVRVCDQVHSALNIMSEEHAVPLIRVSTAAQGYSAKRIQEDFEFEYGEFQKQNLKNHREVAEMGVPQGIAMHEYHPTRPPLDQHVRTYLHSSYNGYRDQVADMLNVDMAEVIRFAIYHSIWCYDGETHKGDKLQAAVRVSQNALEEAERTVEGVTNNGSV